MIALEKLGGRLWLAGHAVAQLKYILGFCKCWTQRNMKFTGSYKIKEHHVKFPQTKTYIPKPKYNVSKNIYIYAVPLPSNKIRPFFHTRSLAFNRITVSRPMVLRAYEMLFFLIKFGIL